MQRDELLGIAAALGSKVVAVTTLAGGFSHETCLLTLTDGQVVARLGGSDPAMEAAVMGLAGRHVPVPQVWRVIPGTDIADNARSVMICEPVSGTLLSRILSGSGVAGEVPHRQEAFGDGSDLRRREGRSARVSGSELGGCGLGGSELGGYELGVEVGRVVARIGRVTFDRPGFFTDARLSVGVDRPWSQQLPGFAAACMDAVGGWDTAGARLDAATRETWVDLCLRHAPALSAVDDQRRLVHADINPKNILVSRAGAGWVVDAVLDWEFAFSGCPYGDAANMARFPGEYPVSYRDGFRAGFVEGQPADAPRPDDWEHVGRVLDMFALSDLVTRPFGHPTADLAADVVRSWVADGVPTGI